MSKVKLIKSLLGQHKLNLALTYSLFAIEMAGALLRPFFLGVAINDLINNSYTGLIYLCLVHLAWTVVGTLRHRLDTRTYTAIYTNLVTTFLKRNYQNNEVSKLSAHSGLAREFVDFLEFDLVYIAEAFFNLLGSLLLLYFYDAKIVGLCMLVLVPVSVLSYFYGKKMRRLNHLKNNELEQQVDTIAKGNHLAIKRHYENLRRWQIKISDQEAINFGLMEVLVIVVIAASLLMTNHQNTQVVLAGDLIGIYTYVLKFVSGLDTVPYAVQKFSSLGDISNRLEFGDDSKAAPLGMVM
jgi:ABC-type multidrug transport system fused ATPase/permease subunit